MNQQSVKLVLDKYGRPAHSGSVNELLGLGPKGKLPKEGMPARDIQGVRVWVLPLEVPRKQRFALRVMCACSVCGAEVALGRLPQHAKVHE